MRWRFVSVGFCSFTQRLTAATTCAPQGVFGQAMYPLANCGSSLIDNATNSCCSGARIVLTI